MSPNAALRSALVLGCLALAGCAAPESPQRDTAPAAASRPRAEPDLEADTAKAAGTAPIATAPGASESAPDVLAGDVPRVVFLGDSLTAGLGVAESQAWPALVGEALEASGTPIQVVNAGVSGDTSAGGVRRLDWLLRQDPALLVVELGANDALRGQPIAEVEQNLRTIVTRARAADVPVLLVGLRIPPSYGSEYAEEFAAVFPRVAKDLGVPLVPFLLEGVGGVAELNQADGIHPNPAGHRRVAETMADAVRTALTAAP